MKLLNRNDKRNQRRLLQARSEAEQSIFELRNPAAAPNLEPIRSDYKRNTSQAGVYSKPSAAHVY